MRLGVIVTNTDSPIQNKKKGVLKKDLGVGASDRVVSMYSTSPSKGSHC